MDFFVSYSRLQLCNIRNLARVPVNFEKFLRFLTEHPKANTFVPFRSLLDFTTALKRTLLPLEIVARAQPYENGIPEKWDPGPFSGTLRQDSELGPYGGSLGWNHKVGP